MGIKNLQKFMKKYCPKVFLNSNISEFKGKRIAVDTSLYIYKYKSIFGEMWLSAFTNLVRCLTKNGIKAVFVFDGKPPPEKASTNDKRISTKKKNLCKILAIKTALKNYGDSKEVDQILVDICKKKDSQKRKRLLEGCPEPEKNDVDIKAVNKYLNKLVYRDIYISKQDHMDIQQLLTIMGTSFVKAPSEAETLCSQLCLLGKVDAVLSEDSDVMAYGTPIYLSKINTSSGAVIKVVHKDIMDGLDMTPSVFLDFCIMCGTDYNDNVRGYAAIKVYKLFQDHGVLEEVLEYLKGKGSDTECLNYKRGRELFSCPNELEDIKFGDGIIDRLELTSFYDNRNIRARY